MLVVFGNAYCNSKERLSEVVSALENDNFVIGYDGNNNSNIIIMKDIPVEEEEDN